MVMSTAKKIVLVSKSGYNARHVPLLEGLIQRHIELFCAVGKDCTLWEDVMDEVCAGPSGVEGHLITTSSHPDQSVEEVIEFAKQWRAVEDQSVEVITL